MVVDGRRLSEKEGKEAGEEIHFDRIMIREGGEIPGVMA